MAKAAAATRAGSPGNSVSFTFLVDREGRDWPALCQAAATRAFGSATLSGLVGDQPETSDAGAVFQLAAGDHRFRLMSMDAPAPGLDGMIQTTRADKELMAPLKGHAAHILCWHLAPEVEATDRIVASIALARQLIPEGLLGVIHVDAHQCFMPQALEHIAAPENAAEVRTMAQAVFCNRIPFWSDAGTWWATKGNHVFGVPDFALWDDQGSGPEQVNALFASLFAFVRGGHQMKPGETCELEGRALSIGAVTEYREHLEGPGTTLALRYLDGQPAAARGAPRGCIVVPGVIGLVLLYVAFGTGSSTLTKILSAGGGLILLLLALAFARVRPGAPAPTPPPPDRRNRSRRR
jgi:hypothetical protein